MQCAWTMEDGRAAAAAANAARALGAPWADVARLRLGYAIADDAVAVAALVDLAQHSPDQLRGEDSRYIWGALNAADRQDASGATSLRLHELLVANAYVPPDGSPDDALRLHHARLLIRRGDLAAARSRLETVIEPQLVMMLRIDRSFDPIRGDPAFERRLDVAAAANAALERARRIASERPRSLDSILGVAQALRALGRHEEALAVLNPAISAAQRPDAAKRFDDVAEKLNWLLNEKAYALYDLGRVAEAHDVFGASIAAGEDGQWSVSQVINFASMLDGEGHARDALEVLRTVGRASPYGDMWTAAVRVCSSEQLHDVTTRDEALTFMRA